MVYDHNFGFVSLSLDAFITENEQEEYVARFPAFPGRLGIGDTRDQAMDSLRCVLEEWVTLFLERNSIEDFQHYLLDECGFQLVQRPFKKAPSESEGWEQALLSVPIPEHLTSAVQ